MTAILAGQYGNVYSGLRGLVDSMEVFGLYI